MPAGWSGAQSLRLAKQLVGGKGTIMISHKIGFDRRPLLQVSAAAADAEVDSAGILPVEKHQGLGLHDFAIVAIADGASADFGQHGALITAIDAVVQWTIKYLI